MSGFSKDDLLEFVYREARLIDEKRLEEWYELFSEDAFYWIPLTPGQPEGALHTSLMYEDKFLLRLRIERFRNPKSYSLVPESRCLHVLQRPEIESSDAATATHRLRTNMIYMETRGDEKQVYGATVHHTLVEQDGRLRIRLKRVDLLDCDAALPSIQLFM
jgi:3-phenylpropionate/cinnamic acid dioxygenase small subunit